MNASYSAVSGQWHDRDAACVRVRDPQLAVPEQESSGAPPGRESLAEAVGGRVYLRHLVASRDREPYLVILGDETLVEQAAAERRDHLVRLGIDARDGARVHICDPNRAGA